MIAAADLQPSDVIIEIGPGFGALTFALAGKVKKVIAFEIEKKLEPYWEEKLKEQPNIEIIWGNVLKKFGEGMGEVYKVIANIPYHITSDILRLFLEAEHKPERLVLMVQKEVAKRICAKPPDMSLLSVAVQYYGQPKFVTAVPRGSFWPAPKVDSAIVAISLKHPSTSTSQQDRQFFRVVKAGFSHKRKQLWRNLSTQLHLAPLNVKAVILKVVGSETVRAEELGVEEWKQITDKISN